MSNTITPTVFYRTLSVEGLEIFYREVIPSAELHLLDTGHFALEEEVDRIGSLMHEFLDRTINKKQVLKGRLSVARRDLVVATRPHKSFKKPHQRNEA